MRWGERSVASRALLCGLLATLLTAPFLFALHHPAHPRLSAQRAASLALRAPQVHAALGSGRGLSARVESFDGQLERVDFFRGERIVAAAALTAAGHTTQFADYARYRVPYGNWIAYEPGVLVGFSLLFVLMSAVWPWRRLRNLDVLAGLLITVAVACFASRYLELALFLGAAALLYLLVRCLWVGLAAADGRAADRPLLTVVMGGFDPSARRRILGLGLGALAIAYLMLAVTSPQAVDVAFAVMEGATRLLHGVLPYGHLPGDVVHGDTYPLLSYLAYTPLAAISPVRSLWDSVDLALAASALAALCSGAILLRTGRARAPMSEEGMRLALGWLCFPPVLIAATTGTTDLALGALLIAAVAAWRRSATSAGLLTAAAWFKLAPFALLPLWLMGRSRPELRRGAAAVAGVSVPLLVLVLGLDGLGGIREMVDAMAFQFTRGTSQSVWATLGIVAWQPLAQALAIGVLAGAAVRLRLRPAGAGEIAALCAAVLIALQLAANYWAFLYVVWFVPLVAIALFRSDAAPAAHPARRTARARAVPVPVGA